MDREIKITYKYGKYYNPAWMHYGEQTNVMCDRCKSNNLKTCIGYKTYDLCMQCVSDMNKVEHVSPISTSITLMSQDKFYPAQDVMDATFMMQDDMYPRNYADRGGNAYQSYPSTSNNYPATTNVTRMRQNIYAPANTRQNKCTDMMQNMYR